MQLEKLRIANFAFNAEIPIQDILDTAEDASIGYFVVVNLSCPPRLLHEHRDFP